MRRVDERQRQAHQVCSSRSALLAMYLPDVKMDRIFLAACRRGNIAHGLAFGQQDRHPAFHRCETPMLPLPSLGRCAAETRLRTHARAATRRASNSIGRVATGLTWTVSRGRPGKCLTVIELLTACPPPVGSARANSLLSRVSSAGNRAARKPFRSNNPLPCRMKRLATQPVCRHMRRQARRDRGGRAPDSGSRRSPVP